MSKGVRLQTGGKRMHGTSIPAGGRKPGKGRLRRRNSIRRPANTR